MNKILNKTQTVKLLADILSNDVKRDGTYIYRDYTITVSRNLSEAATQAIKAFRHNKIAHKAKVKYDSRKAEGLCVKCGKRNKTKMVKCKRCNDKANALRKMQA